MPYPHIPETDPLDEIEGPFQQVRLWMKAHGRSINLPNPALGYGDPADLDKAFDQMLETLAVQDVIRMIDEVLMPVEKKVALLRRCETIVMDEQGLLGQKIKIITGGTRVHDVSQFAQANARAILNGQITDGAGEHITVSSIRRKIAQLLPEETLTSGFEIKEGGAQGQRPKAQPVILETAAA